MARRLAKFEDEDGCEGPFARAMERGLPRRRSTRSTAATTPMPVVETKSAPTTLETHLDLLRRAASALERHASPRSATEQALDAIRAELAKWERRP